MRISSEPEQLGVGLVRYSWHAIRLEVFKDIPTLCR
ncbi:hypothetical protein F383_37203 [Gossypium arboreum]|uniref:Uncharacterized protein n=1 Tax=Gossypium arboreum TaxID=29729 RepID=A0A0B0MG02_GOSAR|nr:hypothetical protein F383_37203 [Gossypium arboreum]